MIGTRAPLVRIHKYIKQADVVVLCTLQLPYNYLIEDLL